nr:PREDICTED: cilia- and flagella-associated protein 45-like [Bemisia tabaci]
MDTQKEGNRLKKRGRTRRRGPGKNEVIRLVEHNGIRDLRIPCLKRKPKPIVLDPKTMQQIEQNSKVVTFEDKIKKIEEMRRAKEKEAEEIEAHSRKLREDFEKKYQEHEELTAEERERAEYLLQRAEQIRFEQEDEIKRCNALILATKCNAIRDAQVAEKRIIKKKLENYEIQMEEMMEKERQRVLQEYEKKKENELERKHEFILDIIQQIQENQRALDREAAALEKEIVASKHLAKTLEAEAAREKEEMLEKQKKRRQEMAETNEQQRELARRQKEQIRLADLKIQEFMRQKAEREARREEEIKQQRLLREKELIRMRAEQDRAIDEQARRDIILAIRIQDEVERNWRERERAAVVKEAIALEKLKEARAAQILDKRKCQAVEVMKRKEEIQKMIQVCQEEQEEEKLTQMQKLKVKEEYRRTLLEQIKQKEEEKKKERQRIIQLGEQWKAEQDQRDRKIKEIMMKKIDAVRSRDVPEIYIREIERQLRLTSP